MKNALVDQRPIRFAVNGRSVDVRVRSSDRAKTMRITVGPRRPLEVVVPTGTTDERIQRFLHQKRRWIDDKVASSEAIANRPSVLGLDKTGVVWIGGRPLDVQRRIGGRPIARAAEPSMLTVSGPATRHADAIERWYRRQARRHIARSVQHESARLALKYPRSNPVAVTTAKWSARAGCRGTSRSLEPLPITLMVWPGKSISAQVN